MRDLDAYLVSKGLPTKPSYSRVDGLLQIEIRVPKRFIHLEPELIVSITKAYSNAGVLMTIKDVWWHGNIEVKAIKSSDCRNYSPEEYIDNLVADVQIFVTDFLVFRDRTENQVKDEVMTPKPVVEPSETQPSCCGSCQTNPYDRRRGYTGGHDFYSGENTGDVWAFRSLGREYHTPLSFPNTAPNIYDKDKWYYDQIRRPGGGWY